MSRILGRQRKKAKFLKDRTIPSRIRDMSLNASGAWKRTIGYDFVEKFSTKALGTVPRCDDLDRFHSNLIGPEALDGGGDNGAGGMASGKVWRRGGGCCALPAQQPPGFERAPDRSHFLS